MLEFLQTGKAIYVLAAVCFLGMASKLAVRSLYKRLIRETRNMMLTKNRWLRELRQRAEDTYRLNQGVANTRAFVEKQIYEVKMGAFSIEGWCAFSNQMTALCFLLGGGAAFLSYWYRCDSYYIVLYSSMGILSGIFNIMVDYGTGLEGKRQRLSTCLQDYLENSLWKRLGRDKLPNLDEEKEEESQTASKEPVRILRGRKRENAASYSEKSSASSNTGRLKENSPIQMPRGQEKGSSEKGLSDEALTQLRKSLEQAAAGRSGQGIKVLEKAGINVPSANSSEGENWMKDLKPEEIKVLGEIIREYLG